jgi:shikimate dehydrogenase
MKYARPIKLGIIGDPIGHSLSPALHQWLLKRLGVEGEYRAYHVRDSELAAFLEMSKRCELLGFNVTIPHKISITRWLDSTDQQASLIGAVNTVKNSQGYLMGYNTDSIGFLRSLESQCCSPKRVIILGAGGAARAVAHALVGSGIATLAIYNRTTSRAQKLAGELQQRYPNTAISVGIWSDPQALSCDLRTAELVVNATPMSTVSLPERLSDNALVYDLVYNPPQTSLLIEAERRGAQTMNGLDMLIYQAIESLKIWLGMPDLESQIAYDSLKRFLEKRLKEHL